jgi:hypothetical protein
MTDLDDVSETVRPAPAVPHQAMVSSRANPRRVERGNPIELAAEVP